MCCNEVTTHTPLKSSSKTHLPQLLRLPRSPFSAVLLLCFLVPLLLSIQLGSLGLVADISQVGRHLCQSATSGDPMKHPLPLREKQVNAPENVVLIVKDIDLSPFAALPPRKLCLCPWYAL